MEFPQPETYQEKVTVITERQDEVIILIYYLPLYKWFKPRALGISLEIVGLREATYPKPVTFTRKELAQIAGNAILNSDFDVADPITDFFKHSSNAALTGYPYCPPSV